MRGISYVKRGAGPAGHRAAARPAGHGAAAQRQMPGTGHHGHARRRLRRPGRGATPSSPPTPAATPPRSARSSPVRTTSSWRPAPASPTAARGPSRRQPPA